MTIVTARVVRIGDSELYQVQINHDGPIVLDQESHTVCSRVAHLLCNPLAEIGTECADVADVIREAYERGDYSRKS